MMNSLSAGFYLPVPVVEDFSKKLFFLSGEHQDSLESAYSIFDELKRLSPCSKISHFMSSKDINFPNHGVSKIRPVKSCPREEQKFNDSDNYERWLEDKVFLRTERFFSGRPSWNIASTRHALLGNYQFKGVGFTGVTGRCDFPHIHGQLDIYLSLYETVMSWRLSTLATGAQRVVALWKDDDRKKPQVLMLREARSLRLAQIAGISLNEAEKEIIFKSLGISNLKELDNKFLEVIRNYAKLFAHSYEIGSPTLDNLMLDGSLIDCSGIFHHNGGGWIVPIHLTKKADGMWTRAFDFSVCIQSLIQNTHKTYQNLGLQMNLIHAETFFWDELAALVGNNAIAIRSFFRNLSQDEDLSLEKWRELLQRSFPDARICFNHPEKSGFDAVLDESKLLVLVSFQEGPNEEFYPFKITDRFLQLLSTEDNLDPYEFAKALIRIVTL